MAFDGIVAKSIVAELNNLIDYKIDKAFEPNKNTITLGLYGKSKNVLLNICIEAKYCRINLTTHPKQNPITAANFCMLLRKHILGYKISNIYTIGLERVIFVELSSFDNIDNKKLIIELMGKHSNIILINKENIIIDSLRHTDSSANSYRDIFPGKKYVLPTSEKLDFLSVNSFEEFYNLIPDTSDNIAKDLSNLFTGFSLSFAENIVNQFEVINKNSNGLKNAFYYIKTLIKNIGTNNLTFSPIYDNYSNMKDYILTLKQETSSLVDEQDFSLNFFLDDFYSTKETSEEFKNYRDTLLKLIFDLLKKYNKRLEHINQKLNECNDMEVYKLYGELITANLYKLKDCHINSVQLENYYDNNNLISIPLDVKYTPAINAKRYFKKYSKLKNALNIVNLQKRETLEELDYIESIVYELENCSSLIELQDIFDELSENILFKEKLRKNTKPNKKKNTKKKSNSFSFSPITYTVDNHTVLVGRNNKENDYLTIKHSNNYDIWFHTKDVHGSHVILKVLPNEELNDNLLIECAKIAVRHSKAKNSSNVPVDYCFVRYVKKPSGSKPGMVIYTNNKTLFVTP